MMITQEWCRWAMQKVRNKQLDILSPLLRQAEKMTSPTAMGQCIRLRHISQGEALVQAARGQALFAAVRAAHAHHGPPLGAVAAGATAAAAAATAAGAGAAAAAGVAARAAASHVVAGGAAAASAAVGVDGAAATSAAAAVDAAAATSTAAAVGAAAATSAAAAVDAAAANPAAVGAGAGGSRAVLPCAGGRDRGRAPAPTPAQDRPRGLTALAGLALLVAVAVAVAAAFAVRVAVVHAVERWRRAQASGLGGALVQPRAGCLRLLGRWRSSVFSDVGHVYGTRGGALRHTHTGTQQGAANL